MIDWSSENDVKMSVKEWEKLKSDIQDEIHLRRLEGTIDKEGATYLARLLGEWNIAVRCHPYIPKPIHTYLKSVACGGPIYSSYEDADHIAGIESEKEEQE